MAYPFIKFPKISEFIEKLRLDHGIVLNDLEQPLVKDETTHLSIHYLEGTVEGKTVRCVVDIQDYDERVSPSLLRSICSRFKLDPESFHSTEPVAKNESEEESQE